MLAGDGRRHPTTAVAQAPTRPRRRAPNLSRQPRNEGLGKYTPEHRNAQNYPNQSRALTLAVYTQLRWRTHRPPVAARSGNLSSTLVQSSCGPCRRPHGKASPLGQVLSSGTKAQSPAQARVQKTCTSRRHHLAQAPAHKHAAREPPLTSPQGLEGKRQPTTRLRPSADKLSTSRRTLQSSLAPKRDNAESGYCIRGVANPPFGPSSLVRTAPQPRIVRLRPCHRSRKPGDLNASGP